MRESWRTVRFTNCDICMRAEVGPCARYRRPTSVPTATVSSMSRRVARAVACSLHQFACTLCPCPVFGAMRMRWLHAARPCNTGCSLTAACPCRQRPANTHFIVHGSWSRLNTQFIVHGAWSRDAVTWQRSPFQDPQRCRPDECICSVRRRILARFRCLQGSTEKKVVMSWSVESKSTPEPEHTLRS